MFKLTGEPRNNLLSAHMTIRYHFEKLWLLFRIKLALILFKLSASCWEVIKHLTHLAQLDMKFILFINVKMPTIVGILTYL